MSKRKRLQQARAEALDALLADVERQLAATPAERAWAAGTHTPQTWPVWSAEPLDSSVTRTSASDHLERPCPRCGAELDPWSVHVEHHPECTQDDRCTCDEVCADCCEECE